jgi:NADH-quinone oxidoreductase subunit L
MCARVLAASLGVLALPAVAAPLDRALGAAGEPSPAWWQLAVTAMAALLASAVTWWWGARPAPLPALARDWLAGWLHLERAARVLVADPTVWLARALAAFDDDGVDRVVAGVAAAARSAGRLARRPETGRLDTYYAQAAVALVLLALIFVLVR